jgi:uncharacterized protein DUF1259
MKPDVSRFPRLFLAVTLLAGCQADSRSGQTAEGGTQLVPQKAAVQPIDWKNVESAFGRSGAEQPGGVYRFSMPRSDLRVSTGTVVVRPALALGSWAAFAAAPGGAMVMGDLVLLERELTPVLSKLQESGIEQTAIHHHLLRETPRVYYVHIHGMGDPVRLARSLRGAVALTGTPPAAAVTGGASSNVPIGIDTAEVANELDQHGRVNGGVFQVSVPRREAIRDGGIEIPPSMGVATVMNFQPTGAGRAAITGDFVLVAAEVNLVIRALRASGIEVTSLHSHLLTEDPRLFFLHFWAVDDAVKLAKGLRAALNATNSLREP